MKPQRAIRIPLRAFTPLNKVPLQNNHCSMPSDIPLPSKVLVRYVSLDKFWGPAGRQVKRAEAAFNFPNLLNAINACLGRSLKDVELVLRYDGEVPERRIPLDAIQ